MFHHLNEVQLLEFFEKIHIFNNLGLGRGIIKLIFLKLFFLNLFLISAEIPSKNNYKFWLVYTDLTRTNYFNISSWNEFITF